MIDIFENHGFNEHSTFLDIGSGFGKVVFQVACETKALCCGYEVLDVKANQSLQYLEHFRSKYAKEEDITEILSRV